MKEKYRPDCSWHKYYNRIARVFYRIKKEKSYDISSAKKILLCYPHLLGDSVLFTPFLMELKRICPEAQIDLVGDKACEIVLNPLGVVTNFYNFGNSGGMHGTKQMLKNYKEIATAVKEIRKEKYDVAIDPFCDWGATYLVRKAKAEHKIGFDFFGVEYSYSYTVKTNRSIDHIVDDMLYLLHDISNHKADKSKITPKILLGEEQKNFLDENRDKIFPKAKCIIGIHPGASQESKKWLGYAELIKRIDKLYLDIAFVVYEGPGEEETVNNLFCDVGNKLINEMCRIKLPLSKYIASLSLCNIVVCNDSSCGHLAAALGIPVVVIYGQGCPAFIGVRSDAAPVEIVDVKNVDCKPCYKNVCPKGNLNCIRPITVSEVEEKVINLIDGSKRKNNT